MRQYPTRVLGELPQSLQCFRLFLEPTNVMKVFVDAEPSQFVLPDGSPAQLISGTRPGERLAQAQPEGAALWSCDADDCVGHGPGHGIRSHGIGPRAWHPAVDG